MAQRLLVFDRSYACVLDRLFVDMPPAERTDTMRLVLGMCHSLRAVLARLSGDNHAGAWNDAASISMAASAYGLHYWEAPAGGWRLVLIVRAEAHERARDVPAMLFAGAFVPSLARSPVAHGLYPRGHAGQDAQYLTRVAHAEGAFADVPGLCERSDAILRSHNLLA